MKQIRKRHLHSYSKGGDAGFESSKDLFKRFLGLVEKSKTDGKAGEEVDSLKITESFLLL